MGCVKVLGKVEAGGHGQSLFQFDDIEIDDGFIHAVKLL
jgi:hypothetical protein